MKPELYWSISFAVFCVKIFLAAFQTRPRKARAAPVGPWAATNCSAALKAVDAGCNVIGSGATHVLTSQFFDSYDKAFQVLHAEELQYLNRGEENFSGAEF